MAPPRSSPTRPSTAETTTSKGAVRRNLFQRQHHPVRRPTSASTTNTTSGAASNSTSILREAPANAEVDDEIVAKDSNGNYQIRVPTLPPLMATDNPAAQEEELIHERDKFEAKMLELYKDRSLQPGDPKELLSAIQSSLKRKIAALEEENWMFEAEAPRNDD